MSFDEIDELVFDTLYFRRTTPNTCLQTNLAGQELAQQSADVLPQIEYVLSAVVGPGLTHVGSRLFPGSSDRRYEEDPFPGLSGLLGAYMLIGSKSDAGRVVGFLRTLPTELQVKAVALLPVYFRKAKFRPQEKDVNDLKELPDEKLLSFVQEASQSENQNLRENAQWVMSFFPL